MNDRVNAGFVVVLALLLVGCGERAAPGAGGGSPVVERASSVASATPVRVGEAGASFAACQAAGTTRNLAAGQTLAVRAAPFDSAAVTAQIAPAARFFVCARSIDEHWMGVVYEEGGTLSSACGVSAPVPSRRAYVGPCRSGWVASASVRLVAG